VNERVDGLRDTGYGTDHACEGCFHPPRGEAAGAGGRKWGREVHIRYTCAVYCGKAGLARQ